MRRRFRSGVEANAYVVMSDVFIALSFILILFLVAVSLSSSSALDILDVRRKQDQLRASVAKQMADLYTKRVVTVETDGNIQRFYFSSTVLFGEGQWEVSAQGQTILKRFATALAPAVRSGGLRMILVEGHTDTTPMHPNLIAKGVRSSWDLSLLRSVEVTRYLQRIGVPPGIMGASGRGEYAPRANNTSAGGRSMNRRIEVVLIYKSRNEK